MTHARGLLPELGRLGLSIVDFSGDIAWIPATVSRQIADTLLGAKPQNFE